MQTSWSRGKALLPASVAESVFGQLVSIRAAGFVVSYVMTAETEMAEIWKCITRALTPIKENNEREGRHIWKPGSDIK